MSQVDNFRSLAQASSANEKPFRQNGSGAPPGRDQDRESAIKVGFHGIATIIVSIVDVSKTTIRMLFYGLPILGPIGLIVWNLDFKSTKPRAGGEKSIVEQLGLAQMAEYGLGLFGKLDHLSTVANVAAGMIGKGTGDLPKPGAGDMKTAFKTQPAKAGPETATEPDPSDASAAKPVESGLKKADGKANAKPAKKLSPTMQEMQDAKDALTAMWQVEVDYRTYPPAEAGFAAFITRYPKSKHRQALQQKLDDIVRIPRRAMPERAMIESDVRLTSVRLKPEEIRSVQSCLSGAPRIGAMALVRKSVTIQSDIPAYVAMVEVVDGPADTGDRLALSRMVSGCLARRMAVGSLAILFWSDPSSRTLLPLLSQAQDSLVFARS